MLVASVIIVGSCFWWGANRAGFGTNLAAEMIGIGTELLTALVIVEWYIETRERERWRGATRLSYRLLAGSIQQVFLVLAVWVAKERFTPDGEARSEAWIKTLADDWPGYAAIARSVDQVDEYLAAHVWSSDACADSARAAELWRELEPELGDLDHLTDRIAEYAHDEELVERLARLAENRRRVRAKVRARQHVEEQSVTPELKRMVRTAAEVLHALSAAAKR